MQQCLKCVVFQSFVIHVRVSILRNICVRQQSLQNKCNLIYSRINTLIFIISFVACSHRNRFYLLYFVSTPNSSHNTKLQTYIIISLFTWIKLMLYSCSYYTSTVVPLILLENYTLHGILLRHYTTLITQFYWKTTHLRHYQIDYIVSTGKSHI